MGLPHEINSVGYGEKLYVADSRLQHNSLREHRNV